MDAVADKAAVRAAALSRRAAVPGDTRRDFAQRLAEIGPSLVRDRSPAPRPVASVYHPIRDEADTTPLFEALTLRGLSTALPVTGGRGQALQFLLWRPGDPVAPGTWGVPEPLPTAPSVDPDFLFIPLAAFDRRGFRLGYGAGFYDNSLAALRRRKAVLAVGIAYAVQEVDRVPTEPHDEPLDGLITEREMLFFGQG